MPEPRARHASVYRNPLDPLPLSTRLLKCIKWLVLFGVALAWFKPRETAPGDMLGYLVAIPLYLALYRVLYGEIGELFQGIGYVFTPDVISLVFGELREDWLKTAKISLWVLLSYLCGHAVSMYYHHAWRVANAA